MNQVRYLALLRGINVGGNNIVRMSELRACLEGAGFNNVGTYIQSGNVIFESPLKSTAVIARAIEQAVSEQLLAAAQVVVASKKQIEKVVTKAPARFGADPSTYRYDVIFIREPLCARELLPAIRLNDGVDEAFESNGVVYFSRLISRASQSYLPKLITTAGYKSMTVRNWATTTKLYELMRVEIA